MLKRILAVALTGAILVAGAARADEASVKKAVEAALPGLPVDGVRKTPYLGLYEIRTGAELIYTDEKVTYFFSGNIIDAKTMQNITEKRLRDLTAIKWENLPLDAAVKTVRGNGKRILAVFSDPNCPYCKRFEKDLAKVDNITIYTFLYPILSQDSHDKTRAVWCSADKSKAWNDLMLNNTVPVAARCDTPIEKNVELGRKYRVTGTPTLVFANGTRVPGAIPAEQIEKLLAQNVN